MWKFAPFIFGHTHKKNVQLIKIKTVGYNYKFKKKT